MIVFASLITALIVWIIKRGELPARIFVFKLPITRKEYSFGYWFYLGCLIACVCLLLFFGFFGERM